MRWFPLVQGLVIGIIMSSFSAFDTDVTCPDSDLPEMGLKNFSLIKNYWHKLVGESRGTGLIRTTYCTEFNTQLNLAVDERELNVQGLGQYLNTTLSLGLARSYKILVAHVTGDSDSDVIFKPQADTLRPYLILYPGTNLTADLPIMREAMSLGKAWLFLQLNVANTDVAPPQDAANARDLRCCVNDANFNATIQREAFTLKPLVAMQVSLSPSGSWLANNLVMLMLSVLTWCAYILIHQDPQDQPVNLSIWYSFMPALLQFLFILVTIVLLHFFYREHSMNLTVVISLFLLAPYKNRRFKPLIYVQEGMFFAGMLAISLWLALEREYYLIFVLPATAPLFHFLVIYFFGRGDGKSLLAPVSTQIKKTGTVFAVIGLSLTMIFWSLGQGAIFTPTPGNQVKPLTVLFIIFAVYYALLGLIYRIFTWWQYNLARNIDKIFKQELLEKDYLFAWGLVTLHMLMAKWNLSFLSDAIVQHHLATGLVVFLSFLVSTTRPANLE